MAAMFSDFTSTFHVEQANQRIPFSTLSATVVLYNFGVLQCDTQTYLTSNRDCPVMLHEHPPARINNGTKEENSTNAVIFRPSTASS